MVETNNGTMQVIKDNNTTLEKELNALKGLEETKKKIEQLKQSN